HRPRDETVERRDARIRTCGECVGDPSEGASGRNRAGGGGEQLPAVERAHDLQLAGRARWIPCSSMLLYLIPLFVLGFLLILFGTLVVLSRFPGGKYLRPIVAFASKVPILKRLIEKASEAAIERYNPELSSAMQKLKLAGDDRER